MSSIDFPMLLTAPVVPGALPCFMVQPAEPPVRRPIWDQRCASILTRLADRLSNAEIADRIAAETGMRFKDKTISDRRSDLGLASPRSNEWTAPLRRWRPWQ